MHRRVELRRGAPLGLAVLVIPASAPASEVRARIAEGVGTIPDEAAVITWREAREWGIRRAVCAQTL